MAYLSLRRLVATGLSLAISQVMAQTSPGPAAPPTALYYDSAFAGYRGFNDQPVAPWPMVNETVGKIGGWLVYAKEAAQPAPADGNREQAASGPAAEGKASGSMPGSPPSHEGKP